MFSNNNDSVSLNVSHIGEGLQVEGDLICKGTIEISGIMNGNIRAYNIKLLETGSIIGSVKADIFEVFGYVEGETEAGDVKIGKTATIKGDVFFKENLKIDEGADVDGYLKRLTDNKVKSETVTKQSASKKADKNTVKTEDKKAVNQN